MTVHMTIVEDIRRLDSQGVSHREIARRLGISRDSVAKYTNIEDFSPTPPTPAKRPGAKALDGLDIIINGWLEDDKKRPRKQRHTSRRVFDRLAAEYDYTGSYSTVQRYIKLWHQDHRYPGDGYIELTWAPGVAQVDFGQAEAIIELFSEDIAACLDLPGVGFDPVRYESRKADKTGTITVEDNFYLAGPSFHNRLLTVAIRHDVIEILDETSRPIVTFPRSYDHQDTTVFTALSLLPALITKPVAWENSPVLTLLPDAVCGVLDKADATGRSRMLAGITQASTATSFPSAIAACEQLIAAGQDPAGPGLGMLARRIAQGTEPSPSEVNLSVYDLLPTNRQQRHHSDQNAQVGT